MTKMFVLFTKTVKLSALFFSALCLANNAVISGKTMQTFDDKGEVLSSEIAELTLKNCDVEILVVDGKNAKLIVADREFTAKHISYIQQDDGRCLVKFDHKEPELQ